MPAFQYASFPNSRNRFRTATVNANTDRVTIGNLGQPLTLVRPSNPNRTYLLLTNLDSTFNMLYLYAMTANINPGVTPTNGVQGQLLWNPNSNILYQKQDSGTNTNWTAVNYIDVAEVVLPFQTAGLEALGDVYAVKQDNAGTLMMAYDEGRG